MASNSIRDLLIELGLSTAESFEPFHPRVRDRDDVSALRCQRSGAIVLSRTDHISDADYVARGDLAYWGAQNRDELLVHTQVDDTRRAEILRPLLAGKSWLDVGTGLGGVLDIAGTTATHVAAVEPQAGPRDFLRNAGYQVFACIDDAPDGSFDVISLFHVFEHLNDPVGFLCTLRRKLAPGGLMLLEVPHARDALLSIYNNEAFREFTLWSEHLILHTRETLQAVLKKGGFSHVLVEAIQRYPLANHLHWLAMGRPSGHTAWAFLRDHTLESAYAALLGRLDCTDTLIVWARVCDE